MKPLCEYVFRIQFVVSFLPIKLNTATVCVRPTVKKKGLKMSRGTHTPIFAFVCQIHKVYEMKINTIGHTMFCICSYFFFFKELVMVTLRTNNKHYHLNVVIHQTAEQNDSSHTE